MYALAKQIRTGKRSSVGPPSNRKSMRTSTPWIQMSILNILMSVSVFQGLTKGQLDEVKQTIEKEYEIKLSSRKGILGATSSTSSPRAKSSLKHVIESGKEEEVGRLQSGSLLWREAAHREPRAASIITHGDPAPRSGRSAFEKTLASVDDIVGGRQYTQGRGRETEKRMS